jgi:hypothetical protein
LIESGITLYKTFQTAEVMTKTDPNILTLSEFAAFLGVHYLTARKYANNGLLDDLGAYRLPSGYWRIPLEGAEKFKTSLKATPKKKKQIDKPNKTAKRSTPKR